MLLLFKIFPPDQSALLRSSPPKNAVSSSKPLAVKSTALGISSPTSTKYSPTSHQAISSLSSSSSITSESSTKTSVQCLPSTLITPMATTPAKHHHTAVLGSNKCSAVLENNVSCLMDKSNFINLDDFTADTSKYPDKWCTIGGTELYEIHKKMLEPNSSAWLDDAIIAAFQNILKRQHPKMGSLQSPILATKMAFKPQQGELVQILNINNNHWITISSSQNQSETTVNIYDSLHMTLSPVTKKIIASLFQNRSKCIKIVYHDVQWQSGSSDCGVFAIAFATAFCEGKNPAAIVFDQKCMRSHLLKVLRANTFYLSLSVL